MVALADKESVIEILARLVNHIDTAAEFTVEPDRYKQFYTLTPPILGLILPWDKPFYSASILKYDEGKPSLLDVYPLSQ